MPSTLGHAMNRQTVMNLTGPRHLAVLLLLIILQASSTESTFAAEIRGQLVYEQHCAACHGATGDGNGSATVWLFPKPRNFNSGLFKIQSTPANSLPTDEDLFQTITRGMAGSSMPSFGYLSEKERLDVVHYVKHLASAMDSDGKRVNKFEQGKPTGELKMPIAVPAEPGVTIEALAKGKEAYNRLQCATCHGEHGQGDGPSAPTLKHSWGMPLLPRDFTLGAFRGRSEGRDLYLRIANGMAGTPMPPFDDSALKPDERWALVQFIQSLRRKDAEGITNRRRERARIWHRQIAAAERTECERPRGLARRLLERRFHPQSEIKGQGRCAV
ncbi:MAG: cytochrome c [Verrucomicrobia bacterium]|nr:cytochrome c [Verrucomicrobiota bacterium]